jgi:hypothetical protein
MNSNQRYAVKVPEIIHETIDNEVLIIEFNSGNYYSLSEVGAEIWDALVKGANPKEIVKEISVRYSGQQDEIANGVYQLITELEYENIISPVSTNQTQNQEPQVKEDLAQQSDRPVFTPPKLQKYTDMQELLLLDPIHEVDESGWPNTKNISQEN